MGDDDEGAASAGGKLIHQRQDAGGGVLVEVAGGLVHQHQAGIGDQGPGDRRTLALTAGQLAGLVFGPGAQPYLVQQSTRLVLGVTLAATANDQRQRHVLQRRELRQQMVELVDEADVAIAEAPDLGVAHLVQHGVGHPYFAGAGAVEATEQVEQGGLAGARTADHRDPLAGVHLELELVEHHQVGGTFIVDPGQLAALEHQIVAGGGRRLDTRLGDYRIIHSAAPRQAGPAPRARPDTGWTGKSARRRPPRSDRHRSRSAGTAGH